MKCQFCGCEESKVLDSRASDTAIRRRRECLKCGRRFTTYETIEKTPLLVVKSDGNRQTFDIAKIKRGIVKACEKRPVSAADIDAVLNDIENRIYNKYEREVASAEIGELVMTALKGLDEVAYVRFAAVYRRFNDVGAFTKFIRDIGKDKKTEK
jgi:transcriptional repressor NrdR